MAKMSQPSQQEKEWTADAIRAALRKIRRQLDDLEKFDPQQVTRRDDPKIDALETSIAEALSEVFGADSPSFHRYNASLDTASFNYLTGTPHHEVIEGLMRGKERSNSIRVPPRQRSVR